MTLSQLQRLNARQGSCEISIKETKQIISYSYNVADGCGGYNLTVSGGNGNKATLKLNEQQCTLIKSRTERSFYIRCRKERILCEIDSADDYSALDDIAKKYYLCDVCGFDGINFNGAKRILKAIVESLYRYPRLRSKLCFIGTHHQLEKLLVRMEQGDKGVLNAFNLQYICTEENAKKLGSVMRGILTQLISNHKDYIATAMCAFGLFDAILLDKNDYNDYAYTEFITQLLANEAEGYHPKGCHTPESVVYHELGHLLDDMCGLSDNAEFKTYYKSLTVGDMNYGLSEYACTSDKEFIAEAFSEYMCNPTPRPIASKVVELLNKAYLACL